MKHFTTMSQKTATCCFTLLMSAMFLPVLATTCDYNGSYSMVCKSLNLSSVPKNELGDGVKSLELADNNLEVLEDNCFFEFPTLTVLYLYSNRITDIEVDAFEGLDELKHLDLSHNKIATVDPDSFQENPKLTSLSLKDNPLTPSSSPLIFSNSINNLDLSKCNLTTINTRNFAGLPNLQVLNLRHNSLQQLPSNFFDDLPNLKRVYLQGNPLRCDVMEKLLRKQNIISDYKKVTCVQSEVVKSTTQQPIATEVSETDEEKTKTQAVYVQLIDDDDDAILESYESDNDVDDDDVVEVKIDLRSTMIYMNIALVVVVSLLLVSIVVVILRQLRYSSFCKSSATPPSVDEDNDGYERPRRIMENNKQNYSLEHVYERIN